MLPAGTIAGALYNLLLLHLIDCLYYCTCYTLFLFNTYWLCSILARPHLNKICCYFYCYCVLPRINYYLKTVLGENLLNISKTSMSNRHTDITLIPYLIYRFKKQKHKFYLFSRHLTSLMMVSYVFIDRSLPAWIYRTFQRKVFRDEGSYRS